MIRTYDDAGRLTLDRQAVNGMPAVKNVTYPLYDHDGKLKRTTVTGARLRLHLFLRRHGAVREN